MSDAPCPVPVDLEQARAFIACLFEPGDTVEVRCIYPDREAELPVYSEWSAAFKLADDHELITKLQFWNAESYGIYVGANPRIRAGGKKAEDVAVARSVFVDLDGVGLAEGIATLAASDLPEPTLVISSGHGVHAYWLLDEPTRDFATWKETQRSIIARFDCADKAVHDAPRVMRLPGFLNTKQEGVMCELVICEPSRRYPLARFASAQAARSAVARAPGGNFNLSRFTRDFIANGSELHNRNHHLFRAACDCAGCRVPQAEAESLLIPAVVTGTPPVFTEAEARRTIASAYSKPRTPSAGFHAGASVSSVGALPYPTTDSWPDPEPLPDELPPVMAFDPELLPEAFRPWISDIAERMQCPIDFPAMAIMVAFSSVAGRRVGIRPKKQDDWLVVPNLWGAAIGRPGVMKTPAIQEPLGPLRKLEAEAGEKFKEDDLECRARKRVTAARKKEDEKRVRDALKRSEDALSVAREIEEEAGEEPVRARYIVNDSTVEKLGEILQGNPFGVLVFRDELIGLLKSLDKEGQEGARSFYLEAWNGTGRYTFDRIGRGTLDIPAAIVSVFGGIQPGPLSAYIYGAAKQGAGDDGLLQRFQLMVWPDVSRDWKNVDRWPDTDARKRAIAVFEAMANLEPLAIGAVTDDLDPDGIPFLRFLPDAQKAFDAWRSEHEPMVRSGELHPTLEGHLSKFRSLVPSLALLFHLADGGTGGVTLSALNRALRWVPYLRSHAERVFAQAAHRGRFSARALAKKITEGAIRSPFAIREVYRHNWTGLADIEDVKAAVEYLIDLNWLQEVRTQTAGRTSVLFHINPKVAVTSPSESTDPPGEALTKVPEASDGASSVTSVSPEPGGSGDSAPDGGSVTPGEEETEWKA